MMPLTHWLYMNKEDPDWMRDPQAAIESIMQEPLSYDVKTLQERIRTLGVKLLLRDIELYRKDNPK